MPEIIEAAALLIVTFMRSGERLYNNNPQTYTLCQEQYSEHQTVIGSFNEKGICLVGGTLRSEDRGVGGVFRLA